MAFCKKPDETAARSHRKASATFPPIPCMTFSGLIGQEQKRRQARRSIQAEISRNAKQLRFSTI
jgi:hypothetical protein